MAEPKIAFIGAGSTVFMKNIIGDALRRPSLGSATIALMDVNSQRLDESAIVANKIAATLGVKAKIETHTDQRAALDGADFVVVAFQIGGYQPATVADFEVPKKYGLRQTIADTLGIGGIMRGIRTVPHLWKICEDMLELCPQAILLQYVNPMAINTWAIAEKYPQIRQVGLCHSVQGTAWELARDLGIPVEEIRYRAAGINHMAFYLNFEQKIPDGTYRNLYPDLLRGYREGRFPKPSHWNPRCPNKVRYEMLTRLGYFVTESSEHFAEYVPWFIKRDRPDLIEEFNIPLDEYIRRCEVQIERWHNQEKELTSNNKMEVRPSHEYAARIMLAEMTGEPIVINGNVENRGHIDNLPDGVCVEVPCLIDHNGVQPVRVGKLPPQLAALMQTNINVQELTVEAIVTGKKDYARQAAMLDPHTAAELSLSEISALVDELIEAHGDWIPPMHR